MTRPSGPSGPNPGGGSGTSPKLGERLADAVIFAFAAIWKLLPRRAAR
jgi:hypothetical protein